MRPRQRRRGMDRRLMYAVIAVVAIAIAFSTGLVSALTGKDALRRDCVVPDVSVSTQGSRDYYLQPFRAFATRAGNEGSGDLCVIVAGGNPLAEGRPAWTYVGPKEEHRDAPDYAPDEIAQNVQRAEVDIQSVLQDPPVSDQTGSALIEAMVLAGRTLRSGDHLQMLTDGLQVSASIGRLQDLDLSETSIETYLANLDSQGLVPDLDGVVVGMPLLLYRPDGLRLDPQQEVGVRRFWEQLIERAGGTAVFDHAN